MSCHYYIIVFCFSAVNCDIYNVKIFTENHVNLLDRRFLSFSVDPKDFFSSIGKYNSKECNCMASALAPAYFRIAGPSTEHLTFINNTFSVRTEFNWKKKDDTISVLHKQWARFIKWANSTGFNLVFALNTDHKTSGGVWDANTSESILTAADRIKLGDITWQLGYECKNQSIEEYLNDLETLRVITAAFHHDRWGVVGGDVTPCLNLASKSDFRDYVTLSIEMMDAVLLNGNSSLQELERMPDKYRRKLLKVLAKSQVPLWLTERSHATTDLQRATEWLVSLGSAARNGFTVHYRQLLEEELHEPTLSFYMALLFKNLVGERVLDVEMDISKSNLFAHCTSLHHKPISGALTLYGVNMNDEPARFSIKLPKKEGGDIMQFILNLDEEGNIVVNSHAMYYEGDIRPVVRRVRPYKSLLISLPPKSFGFWVLANSQVEACKLEDDDIQGQEKPHAIRVKRSDNSGDLELLDVTESNHLAYKNLALVERVKAINADLKKIQATFKAKMNNNALSRLRRDIFSSKEQLITRRASKLKETIRDLPLRSNLIRKLLDVTNSLPRPTDILNKSQKSSIVSKINNKRRYIGPRDIQSKRKSHGKFLKRYTKSTEPSIKIDDIDIANKNFNEELNLQKLDNNDCPRKRRSIQEQRKFKYIDSSENTIDDKEQKQFSKMYRQVKKLSNLPVHIDDDYEDDDMNAIMLETKVEDDGALIKISENPQSGIIASTLENLLSFLAGLNNKLKKFWEMTTFIE